MLQRSPLPWTLLGLPADFELEHLELRLLQPTGMYVDDGGIVTNDRLLDPRTDKGAIGGLFDERIFGTLERQGFNIWGPRRDFKLEHQALPRQGELSYPAPRRDRFGRIELGCPMLHPAFLAKDPSWLEQRTGLSVDELRRLDTHEASVVLGSDGEPAPDTVIVTDAAAADPSVTLATGAEAVRTLLRRNGESLDPVIERVWVVPVHLRPIVPVRWARYWLADLNELYERLIRRNNTMLELMSQRHTGDYLRVRQRNLLMRTLELLYCNRSCEEAAVDGAGRVLDGLLDVAGGDALGERLRAIDAATPERGTDEVMPWNELATRRCLQAMGFVLWRRIPVGY